MQPQKILIKNGYIVSDTHTSKGDILTENNIIVGIAPSIEVKDAFIIDAQGQYITPGGIDAHVHLALKTSLGNTCDNFYEGSRAALAGGTTTIIDFVTPEKDESLITAFRKRKTEAETSLIDYALHGSVTSWNSNTCKEMKHCAEKEGASSFKVYMAYGKTIGISDDVLYKTLQCAKDLGILILCHCEDGAAIDAMREEAIKKALHGAQHHALTRPSETESKAVEKLIQMAEQVNSPIYIVHVSEKESLRLIQEAKKKHLAVYAETCPHYLFFTDKMYKTSKHPEVFIMSPPLRKTTDQKLLWRALNSKTIDVVSTDHCSFSLADKTSKKSFVEVPNGVAGIETRLSLLLTYGVLSQKISFNHFVALTSTKPAKLFGLYPQKGILAEGADADIVIWQQKKELISASALHQNTDHTIYEGFDSAMSPQTVIVNGKVGYHNGKLFIEGLKGNYLKRGKCEVQ